MGQVLVRYKVAVTGSATQTYSIEVLDVTNVSKISGIVPPRSLEDKVTFLKARPNWVVCFREDGGQHRPVYINSREAVVRYWNCRRNRRNLIEWAPEVDCLRFCR